jgi:16S rRNA (guanine966-N2)-methyltransferase
LKKKSDKAEIQIIGGLLKGEKITIPLIAELRPTRAQVREAVFQIWAELINGAVFMDPFAGSGAIVLEAISRGAEEVFASDVNPEILFLLRKKLRDLQKRRPMDIGWDRIVVSSEDFREALSEHFVKGRKFDLVYLDPPYSKGYGVEAMHLIERYGLLNPGGRILLEISKHERRETDAAIDSENFFVLKKYPHGDTYLYHFGFLDEVFDEAE